MAATLEMCATDCKDSQRGEQLRLQSLALYDKLPQTDPQRIKAHRSIIHWYRMCNKTAEVEHQTQELARLLGTNDPKTPFPAPPPCYGCGLG